MRWPWQRKEEVPGPEPSPGPPPGAAGPVPSPAGWAFLPPLQRTLGDLGTTTAPHRFTAGLPTRTDPSFTTTMSHLISADAPAGVIDLDAPDAGRAPDPPGSGARPVDLPLLPPPGPRDAGTSRPVQRLATTEHHAMTRVPEGDFGVLRVPVVPEPGSRSPGPSAAEPVQRSVERPAGSSAEQEGTGPVPADAHGRGPEDGGLRDGGSGVADRHPEDRGASSGSAPGAAAAGALAAPTGRPGGPVPPGSPPMLPLQRLPARSGSGEDGDGNSDSGRGFDDSATIVPLPRRGSPLQRATGPASAGAASPPIRASGPATSSGLGLGRPWSRRDPDPAGAEQPSSPAVQRTHGSTGLPPARSGGPADDGPAESSSSTSPAEVRAGPAVPEPPVAQPPTGIPPGGAAVSRGTPQETGHRGPAAGARAVFGDPPPFADGQVPDARRPEVLPVVSRSADIAAAVREEHAAPDDGGVPAGPAVPDQASAGPGAAFGASAPVAPVSDRAPRQHPGAVRSDGRAVDGSPDLPVVLRSATPTPGDGAGLPAGPGAEPPGPPPTSSTPRSPAATSRSVPALGMRTASSLPVVSRSLGQARAPGAARTGPGTARVGARPAAPATGAVPATGAAPDGPAPAPPSGTAPASTATGPTVSRAAVVGPRADPGRAPAGTHPDPGSAGGSLPGAGSGRRAGTDGERAVQHRGLEVPTGVLQRSPADRGAPPPHPGLRGTLPGPRPAPGPAVVVPADASGPGTHQDGAERTGGPAPGPVDLLLALPDRASPAAASADAAEPSVRPAVQRTAEEDATAPSSSPGPGSAGGTPSLQRVGEETDAGAGPAATPAGPGGAPSPAAAPGAPGEEGMSQEQVDALAKRLVGPIVRRIKADMLLDRERRGLRIDVG